MAADTELPAGANLLLLLGSANCDPHVFADPDALDLHRDNARAHLSFGHGIDFCLGASLARLEGQVVLEELKPRLPGLRMIPQELTYTPNTTFRGLDGLLAEWVVPLQHATTSRSVGGRRPGSPR